MVSEAWVRPSGRGVSLVVGGVEASWYQPGRTLTGSVWDAMAAPWAALDDRPGRAALLLGLGGGSTARILRAMAPRARLVGVELDPAVLRAARRHLALGRLGLEIHQLDALEALRRAPGPFDMIVEDCFVQRAGRTAKVAWMPEPGIPRMAARLAPGGLLVVDTLGDPRPIADALRATFARTLAVEADDAENLVLVATDRPLDAPTLAARVEAHPVLGPARAYLRFADVDPRAPPSR